MFQITLRAARESCGYTQEEVAEYCGVSTRVLEKIEIDSQDAPISVVRKALSLYGVSSKLIYFGTESDCIVHNKQDIIFESSRF